MARLTPTVDIPKENNGLKALRAALDCMREMRAAAYAWVRSQPAAEGWDTSEYLRGESGVESDLAGWSDEMGDLMSARYKINRLAVGSKGDTCSISSS